MYITQEIIDKVEKKKCMHEFIELAFQLSTLIIAAEAKVPQYMAVVEDLMLELTTLLNDIDKKKVEKLLDKVYQNMEAFKTECPNLTLADIDYESLSDRGKECYNYVYSLISHSKGQKVNWVDSSFDDDNSDTPPTYH